MIRNVFIFGCCQKKLNVSQVFQLSLTVVTVSIAVSETGLCVDELQGFRNVTVPSDLCGEYG